jgi:putative membrane protein
LIAFGASIYVMSVSTVADFPYTSDTALQYIFYGILGGFACIFAGVGIQRYINRWITGQQPDDEFIDVL